MLVEGDLAIQDVGHGVLRLIELNVCSGALAGGVGCALACLVSSRISKGRTYVNVIMSDNLEAMRDFRDFLAKHHTTNVAADTYTLDWNAKTISITAYAETKAENSLISEYIDNSPLKFKRLMQPV